ncbi:MAG: trehalose-phosphatase [Myxococcota bacterium]
MELVIISGRDAATLEKWLGDYPVTLVAEHGLKLRRLGLERWESLLTSVNVSWKPAVREILEDYTARSPGAFVEEKSASLAWHYRQVEMRFGSWQARELAQHLSEAFANSALEVLHGAKVVEVRPQGFDKGRAYRILHKKLGPFDFAMAAGDDRTDEDMFQEVGPEWSIKIGRGAAHAHYRCETPTLFEKFSSSWHVDISLHVSP